MTAFFDVAKDLDKLAPRHEFSHVRWIATPNGEYETNNGSDWCSDCAFYIFRHLRKHDRRHAGDYFLDGGGMDHESDGTRSCAHCGAPLRVSLTRYGLEEELGHYRENGVGDDLRAEAFHIGQMLDAVSWRPDDDPVTVEVLALAELLLAKSVAA